MNNRKGITVAGTLICDVMHQIDTYPQAGFLTNVRGITRSIGGTGNIIIDLAKLDKNLTVKTCAVIGDDENGKKVIEYLEKYSNIDTENVIVGEETAITIVMTANDTKQRTFFCVGGGNDVFDESYIDFDKLNTKIFHLEYLLLMKKVDAFDEVYGTHGAKILHDAKERGFLTSIDVVSEQSDRARKIVTSALKYTDICCVNELEAKSVTGIEIMENGRLSLEKATLALNALKDFGVSKWVVIHSALDSYGLDVATGEVVYAPSLDIPRNEIKGSTGAGDAYCSGVLYGAHENYSLYDALRLARACATASLTENNGTDGMRSLEETMLLENLYGEVK